MNQVRMGKSKEKVEGEDNKGEAVGKIGDFVGFEGEGQNSEAELKTTNENEGLKQRLSERHELINRLA